MNAIVAPSDLGSFAEAGSRPYGITLRNDASQDLRERPLVAVTDDAEFLQNREENIARITEAAYDAVLELGYRGSFLDLELSLWKVIRQAVEQVTVVGRLH